MRRPASDLARDVLAVLVVLAGAILALAPPVAWITHQTWENVPAALRAAPLVVRQLGNAFALAGLVAGASLAVAIPAGYAFARRRFAGRALALGAAGLALLAPTPLLLVAWAEVSNLAGSRGALSVAVAALLSLAVPAALWLATLAFRTVPSEVLEAARLEGLTEGRVLWRVAAPLAARPLASIGALVFASALGEQLVTSTLLARPELQPLAPAWADLPPDSPAAALVIVLVAGPSAVLGILALPSIARLVASVRAA